MIVYNGRSPPGRHRVSNLSRTTPTHRDQGHMTQACKDTSFPQYIYICIYIYITATPKEKKMQDIPRSREQWMGQV
jgi:hypothetical protein